MLDDTGILLVQEVSLKKNSNKSSSFYLVVSLFLSSHSEQEAFPPALQPFTHIIYLSNTLCFSPIYFFFFLPLFAVFYPLLCLNLFSAPSLHFITEPPAEPAVFFYFHTKYSQSFMLLLAHLSILFIFHLAVLLFLSLSLHL